MFINVHVHDLFMIFSTVSINFHRSTMSLFLGLPPTRSIVESLWGIEALSMRIYHGKSSAINWNSNLPQITRREIQRVQTLHPAFHSEHQCRLREGLGALSLLQWQLLSSFGGLWLQMLNLLAHSRCHDIMLNLFHQSWHLLLSPLACQWTQRWLGGKHSGCQALETHRLNPGLGILSPKIMAKHIPCCWTQHCGVLLTIVVHMSSPMFMTIMMSFLKDFGTLAWHVRSHIWGSEDPNMMSVTSPKDLAAFLTNLTPIVREGIWLWLQCRSGYWILSCRKWSTKVKSICPCSTKCTSVLRASLLFRQAHPEPQSSKTWLRNSHWVAHPAVLY